MPSDFAIFPMIATLGLAVLLGFIAHIDAHTFRIPNPLSLAVIVGGVIFNLSPHGFGPVYSLAGLGVGAGLLLIPAAIYEKARGRQGLGGGDVKLLAGLGAWTGPLAVPPILLIASVSGALFAVLNTRKMRRDAYIPFGPFLCFAGIAVWCFIFWGIPNE